MHFADGEELVVVVIQHQGRQRNAQAQDLRVVEVVWNGRGYRSSTYGYDIC